MSSAASSLPKAENTGFTLIYLPKKNRDNIENDEFNAFRKLAKLYEKKGPEDITKELAIKELLEICHDDTPKTQK